MAFFRISSGGSAVKIGSYTNNNYASNVTISIKDSYSNYNTLTSDDILIVPTSIAASNWQGVGGGYNTSLSITISSYNSSTGVITLRLGQSANTNEGGDIRVLVTAYDVYII